MEESGRKQAVVDVGGLPPNYPTHKLSPLFWEWLGRTIGTFGFLEETLGRAIFSMTGTRPIPEEDFAAELEKWGSQLERALSDPLYNLIESYAKAVRVHPEATLCHLDELVEDLKSVADLRNVLCHGSWRVPDENGFSIPLFVNKKKEIWQTPIDVPYLKQLQRKVMRLTVVVVDSVSHMGWQFPGTSGPGRPVWSRHKS